MYHFVVEYYDELDKCQKIDSGLTGAATYGEAADKVAKYFGDGLITMSLTEWEDVLSEEEVLEAFAHEAEDN